MHPQGESLGVFSNAAVLLPVEEAEKLKCFSWMNSGLLLTVGRNT